MSENWAVISGNVVSINGNIEDKKILEKINKNITKEFITIYDNGINSGKEWIRKIPNKK